MHLNTGATSSKDSLKCKCETSFSPINLMDMFCYLIRMVIDTTEESIHVLLFGHELAYGDRKYTGWRKKENVGKTRRNGSECLT